MPGRYGCCGRPVTGTSGRTLRRFACESERRCEDGAFRGDRVIAPMAVPAARVPFFLDVGHFAAGRDFAVPTDNATASERGETEQANETHDDLRYIQEQISYR